MVEVNEMNDHKDTAIYQLNPLIEARKGFDVMESRLFYLGLQDINPHLTDKDVYFDESFHDTIIPPHKLKEIFGHGQYLSEVDKAANRLIGRYISVKYDDGWGKYTIFQHIEYKEGKGLILHFNEDMRPFLLDIYKSYHRYGFTRIEMHQIFILGSSYAMRILELLLQYRSCAIKGVITREIDLQELRTRLNVPDNAYIGRINNFRKKVLDLPIEDINKNTFYHISYVTVKRGRSIKAIRFICDSSKAPKDIDFKETIEATPVTDDINIKGAKKIEHESDVDRKLKSYGFSKKTIIFLREICGGDEELAKRVSYAEKRMAKQKKKPDSISGYLRTAILENWAGQESALEDARAREVKANVEKAEWDEVAKKVIGNTQDEINPDGPEKEFNLKNPIDKAIVIMIRDELKNGRALSFTAKRRLKEHGMTTARFAELYMKQ